MFEEEVWAVSYESPDDGHRIVVYFEFFEKESAENFKKDKSNQRSEMYMSKLWRDKSGYYEVHRTKVTVQKPSIKQMALAKLSAEEKRALGLE